MIDVGHAIEIRVRKLEQVGARLYAYKVIGALKGNSLRKAKVIH